VSRFKVVAGILITVLAAGCASGPTQPIQVSTLSGEQQLLSSDAVQINIDEKEFARLDDTKVFGKTQKNALETGAIWKRAFIGDPTGNAIFEIKSTLLETTFPFLGFAIRHTYVIEGELRYNNAKFPIHVEGTQATGVPGGGGSLREAIELGVKSAAEQSRLIIQAQKH
jgi:hypothetical protein